MMDTTLLRTPSDDFEARMMTDYLAAYIATNQSQFGGEDRVTVGAHVGNGVFEVITWDPSDIGDEIVIGELVSPGAVVGLIGIEDHHGEPVVRRVRS